MKAVIVLLAAAAFAYRVPPPTTTKKNPEVSILNSIVTEAQCLHAIALDQDVFKSVFVKDLKKKKADSCEAEFFCQAEKVLSGVKFHNVSRDCSVNHLRRNLKVYDRRRNCTVPVNGDEQILRSFLDDLTKCAKDFLSNLK